MSERSRPRQTAWYPRAAEPKPLNLIYDLEIQQQTYRTREYLEASDCGAASSVIYEYFWCDECAAWAICLD